MSGPWSKEDLDTLRRRYPHEPTSVIAKDLGRSVVALYTQAATLGIGKSAEYMASSDAGRFDGNRGAHCRFSKGHRPWNKDLKGFKAGGRSAETRFKPGHRPSTWVPVGTEVVDSDGYLKRKIRDDAPKGKGRFNWEFVHVLLWEQHNGPRPPGHCIIFKDGNKRNIALDNLECISRVDNMRRNSLHNYPKPVTEVIHLRAVLNRQINKRTKGEKQDRGPARSPVRDDRDAQGQRGSDGSGTREDHIRRGEDDDRVGQGGKRVHENHRGHR